LPGSAARIIAQNFASCRLASSFKETFFLVFNPPTSFPHELAWLKMGCGIPSTNTKINGKVNKGMPVFFKEKGCIRKLPGLARAAE